MGDARTTKAVKPPQVFCVCFQEPVGEKFIVVDPYGEIVGSYLTEDAAQQDIERCKKKDAMWDTAQLLVDNAIKAHVQLHDVDRKTAHYWVSSAVEASE
jgi:hypothetical protein